MTTLQQAHDAMPNLRNGDVARYNVLHVAGGIPSAYHIPLVNARGPDATDIRTRLKAYTAFYAGQLAAAGDDDDLALAKGCLLACVRQGMAKSWQLGNPDLVAAQTVTEATWNNAVQASAAGAIDANAIMAEVAEQARFDRVTEDFLPDDLIMKLMRLGQGVLVTTGVTLVKTDGQHHFVDPHKGIHTVMFRQIFGQGADIPFGVSKAVFEDVVFHKSAHVVQTLLMKTIARTQGTKTRLQKAEIASAAVRVPALYPSESAASAVRAVVEKVGRTAEMCNVAMDDAALLTQCDEVTVSDMSAPAHLTESADRQAALTAQHGPDVAYAAGLLRGMASATNARPPRVLDAWSIRKIVEDNPAEVALGVQQVEATFRANRERARRGMISGVGLFGAARPKSTDAIPADETIGQILGALFGATGGAKGVAARAVP